MKATIKRKDGSEEIVKNVRIIQHGECYPAYEKHYEYVSLRGNYMVIATINLDAGDTVTLSK